MKAKHITHITVLLSYIAAWVVVCLQPYGDPFYYRVAGFIIFLLGVAVIMTVLLDFDQTECRILFSKSCKLLLTSLIALGLAFYWYLVSIGYYDNGIGALAIFMGFLASVFALHFVTNLLNNNIKYPVFDSSSYDYQHITNVECSSFDNDRRYNPAYRHEIDNIYHRT